jgi:hypothetical protein
LLSKLYKSIKSHASNKKKFEWSDETLNNQLTLPKTNTDKLCDLKELIDVGFSRKKRVSRSHLRVQAAKGPNINFPKNNYLKQQKYRKTIKIGYRVTIKFKGNFYRCYVLCSWKNMQRQLVSFHYKIITHKTKFYTSWTFYSHNENTVLLQ